ncbi:hypothetical protein, partial [Alcanivorax hongdengensis]|uniref:hypothetical protein n=1 Tax=Alcanivorax hongdengensis TaxID=519051 RepID=UPI00192B3789
MTPVVRKFLDLPLIVTEDLFLVTTKQSFIAPSGLNPADIAELLPRLAVASHLLANFPRIIRLVDQLNLDSIVSHIGSLSESRPIEEIISVDPNPLRDLYSLFADIDHLANSKSDTYQKLLGLPIWKSSGGLVSGTQALLPGNFTDPTGQAALLDTSTLTESARLFLTTKLGVKTQTIETFVQTVLPNFFGDDGPTEPSQYNRIISELANHSSLINDNDILRLLGSLSMVPTQDGGWSRPVDTYRRTDELVRILGDARHLWLDTDRTPPTRSAQTFIDNLGIRRRPNARHLVDRMLYLAEQYRPTDDTKRASSDAFYVLCENYDKWRDRTDFKNAINDLRQAACFPAFGDEEKWHTADELYAVYRADAFRSQANILDFRNTARLKTDLLEYLGVSINPETQLVIDHLLHCISSGGSTPLLRTL